MDQNKLKRRYSTRLMLVGTFVGMRHLFSFFFRLNHTFMVTIYFLSLMIKRWPLMH